MKRFNLWVASFFFITTITSISGYAVDMTGGGDSAATASGADMAAGGNGGAAPTAPAADNGAAPAAAANLPNTVITNQTAAGVKAASDARASKNLPVDKQVAPSISQETEFQRLVAQSLGKSLPLFGYDLFNAPSTFSPVEQIPVTSDYVVGPGDEIQIRAWGQLDVDYKAVVDRLGAIYIPKVGTVQVAGVKYQDLESKIRSAVGQNFTNFTLQVNLGQLRSIQVFVVGQAKRPGSFTVSSLATLINAVFASGGPSVQGSLRHIQLKRQNQVIADLDLYHFLLKGDKSEDIRLLPGDVIYYAPVGPVAGIAGSVKTPAIYELKDNTDLGELVELASGLTTSASDQAVNIERISRHHSRVVDVVKLDVIGVRTPIKDGDLVRVGSISPKFDNAVTLRGNVASPMRFPWRPGMTLTDLIPNKDALITRSYWVKKNLANRETDAQPMNTTGLDPESSLRFSANDIDWNYAVVERQNKTDLSSNLIPFNLGQLVLNHDQSQNVALMPGDVVTIFSQNDLTVPQEGKTMLVRVDGEVAHAGVYRALPGETLRQLVIRIGGLSPDAYLYGAVFTRESTRKSQQQHLQETVDRMERDLNSSAGTLAQGALDQKGMDASKAQVEAQRASLEKMRSAKVSGRISLDITGPSDRLSDIPDLPLEDGDHLMIPPRPATIGVYGDVYAENGAYIFNPDKRLGEYLKMAGGPTEDADASRTFVIRANGSLVSKQNSVGLFDPSFNHMVLYPGDVIVVPEQKDKTPAMKTFLDYTTTFMNLGVTLATLKFIGII
ncbi:MAG: sugar transporter [Ferrovum sp.]|nr:sugar transporter [Ferrovum sp.]